MAVCGALLGKREDLLDLSASSKLSRERKQMYFSRFANNHDIICLQEIHGKDEFLQAISDPGPTIPAIGTSTPYNLNAGGLTIGIHESLFTDGAIVTHLSTCQGRNHIVTIQSGAFVLVVVNVHFDPDLTMRRLRERLRLFHSALAMFSWSIWRYYW